MLVAELVRHHSGAEAALLGALLAIVITVGLRAATAFRAAPTGFPEMPPRRELGLRPKRRGEARQSTLR